MQLDFTLDTHGTCVGQLREEWLPLVELAESWAFPYNIYFVWRVLPEAYGRKTFRRFDNRECALYLDMSIIYEHYQQMSKNEQREALGLFLYDYLSESIAKYGKYADKEKQVELLSKVKQWMIANDWLAGKIGQARELLAQDVGLSEVSRQLKMPLHEVEDIFQRMHKGDRAQVHPDNLVADKAPPYLL